MGKKVPQGRPSPRVAGTANIPTEMAMKLTDEWNRRGYGLDVVSHRRYDGSTYVDPHEEENFRRRLKFRPMGNEIGYTKNENGKGPIP